MNKGTGLHRRHRRLGHLKTAALALAIAAFALAGCGGDDSKASGTQDSSSEATKGDESALQRILGPRRNRDSTPPTVTIGGQTQGATAGTVGLMGSASDNKGLNRVTWVNDRGGGGTATLVGSTTSATWGIGAITLASGDNTITVTAVDNAGNAANAKTILSSPTQPTVTLGATPNAVMSGSSTTLNWQANNATSCMASGGWSGTRATSGSESTAKLSASTNFTLNCTGSGGTANGATTVAVTQLPTPTVTLSASPTSVTSGGASTLNWSSSDATACTASGGWSGTVATSGSAGTGALNANTTFGITCTGAGGSASASTSVSVAAPPPPTVALSASPTSITSGGASTLTWSSTNATSCTGSGGWSGAKPTSGSSSTGALSANTTFVLICTGGGGTTSASASVAVTAPTPAPTITLGATPTSVISGSASTLSWGSTNATSCDATGGWSGAKGTSGTASTDALTANTTFGLVCTGAGGSSSASTSVAVTTPVPTATMSASPSGVTSGGTSTLTWSSTNATSCNATGGWSGTKATSGSASTGALSANTTFGLTCTGAGGSASTSAAVSVTAPAPSVSIAATPTSVTSGSASNLTWSSSNATSCSGSGSWSDALATSGTTSTGALTAPASYTITCTGAGGSASGTANVAVAPAPLPAVTLSASPGSVTSGSNSMLSWSSTNATSCTSSGGWTGTRGTSGTYSTGALSTSTTYTLACTGAGGTTSASTTVSVSTGGSTIYGLEWDGRGTTRRMLYWSNPFPIYDATYIFKVYPRKKPEGSVYPNGYYTTFFWGNNGNFRWSDYDYLWGVNTYYGAHPYPWYPPNGPGQWEISVYAEDYVTGTEVVWDRWYTQAFRAWRESSSITHHEFYYDLPDLTKVIRTTVNDPRWAAINPPSPAIVVGQAPNYNGVSWGSYPGWEEHNGIIRGIQIYSGLLSVNDILAEINSPQSTNAGRNFIWYLNVNPRPNDVTDKKTGGTPHNPAWDGSPAKEWSQVQ